MTAAQRDWLLRTRVPARAIRFHRFEAASSALVRCLSQRLAAGTPAVAWRAGVDTGGLALGLPGSLASSAHGRFPSDRVLDLQTQPRRQHALRSTAYVGLMRPAKILLLRLPRCTCDRC